MIFTLQVSRMKYFIKFLLFVFCLPVYAGIIRHDTPDAIYTQPNTNPALNSVGLVVFNTAEGPNTCSGTVINKNWVLTAGHCVNKAEAISFYLPSDAGWRFYQANTWVSHERFLNDDLLSGWDLGLMHFNSDFDITPAQLYSGDDELFSDVVSTGFGYSGDGYTGALGIDYLRRTGTNMIDELWSNEGDGRQILWSDFDHPVDSLYNLFNYPDFSFDDLATTLEIMPAPGDSGGGLFIERDGKLYLAGIQSFAGDFNGDGILGYGDAFGSTRVSSLFGWIQNKINPVSVPEPNTFLLFLLGLIIVVVVRKLNSSRNSNMFLNVCH